MNQAKKQAYIISDIKKEVTDAKELDTTVKKNTYGISDMMKEIVDEKKLKNAFGILETKKDAVEANELNKTMNELGHLEKGEKKMATLALLLPTPENCSKTTSTSIAERINVWQQNRLSETKSDLEKQLYQRLVKINVNRLEAVYDLTKLRKSSSTGHLDKLLGGTDRHHGDVRITTQTHHRVSQLEQNGVRNGKKCNSPQVYRRLKSGSATEKIVTRDEYTTGNGDIPVSVSPDSEDEEVTTAPAVNGTKTTKGLGNTHTSPVFRMSSCQLGRQCNADRYDSSRVEQVKKRFAHQRDV